MKPTRTFYTNSDAPAMYDYRKNIIYISIAIKKELDPSELDMLKAHEGSHASNRSKMFNRRWMSIGTTTVISSVVSTIFPFLKMIMVLATIAGYLLVNHFIMYGIEMEASIAEINKGGLGTFRSLHSKLNAYVNRLGLEPSRIGNILYWLLDPHPSTEQSINKWKGIYNGTRLEDKAKQDRK